MPKDVVLSTKTFILSHLVILIVSLSFFGGLYYILYQDKFQTLPQAYNPVTKEPTSFILEISSPDDDMLVNDASIVISGTTGPDTAVIITSAQNSSGLQSGRDGQFSKVFPLSEGPNIVTITAFDHEGNTKSITKSIYYSKEKI